MKSQIISLIGEEYRTILCDVIWSWVNKSGTSFNAVFKNTKGDSGSDIISVNKYKNNIQENGENDLKIDVMNII